MDFIDCDKIKTEVNSEVNGKMSKQLMYLNMRDRIKQDILKERYIVGSLLPTESELQDEYDVSRTTIRKAMSLLADEGYVEIKQGRGTRVLNFKAKQDFNRVTSVTESLRRKGYTVTTKSMQIDQIPATYPLTEELKVKEGELLARVQRIQLADGKPICIMTNYIPYQLVPGLEQASGTFTALYQHLEDNYGFNITSTKDRIFAVAAAFYEAELLDIPIGMPILQIERTCYNLKNPICYDSVKIIGSQYEVEITTEGRDKGAASNQQ
jgi:DNA-binding GntR family transcriptional regulator